MQLTAFTDLTLGQSKSIRFHTVGQHLQTAFNLGPENKVLIVIDDIDGNRLRDFAPRLCHAFLPRFAGTSTKCLIRANGQRNYIRCSLADAVQAPADIRAALQNNTDAPITVAMFEPQSDQPREMIIASGPIFKAGAKPTR